MRFYAFLGRELQAERMDAADHPYADWIQTYAAPEFEVLAETLERLLKRYGSYEQARVPYRRALLLELSFFEANAQGLVR
jgi:thiaminase/transcriptional activator TenA